MDSYASSPHRDTRALRDRIADVVYQSFRRALADRCDDRHGLDVTTDRTTTGQSTQLGLQCGDRGEMTASLTVQHVGGNVYDVHCAIDGGPSKKFVYCLAGGASPDTGLALVPRLGREIAGFVLDALERSLGREGLQLE